MNRRDFLASCMKGVAIAGLTPAALQRLLATQGTGGRRPNVVLILADDQGYADFGLQGCLDIPTPNIDSIGRDGVRFTSGYVSCPVCSPTRAGLLTGRYQQRFGHEFNPGPQAGPDFGLSKDETTIAERLKKEGYATGMFGKWHLGSVAGKQPLDRGFDEFFGFFGGAHSYLRVGGGAAGQGAIMDGRRRAQSIVYTTEEFAARACRFIEKHKGDPFFVYLPFNAVHAPLEATEKYLKRFEGIKDEKRKKHAAQLSAMDDAVGTVLTKLADLKLDENTLVIYLSDNGGPTPTTTASNVPLRGYKAQMFEGGIRVPFMMRWKGSLPHGTVFDAPVSSLDLHPTILAAAGIAIPEAAKLDGVDLVPFAGGKKDGKPHDRLCWRMGEQHATRLGDYKLVKPATGEAMLFDLKADIGEQKDLAKTQPDKLKELQSAYDAWDKEMMAAKWKRQTGAKKKRKIGG